MHAIEAAGIYIALDVALDAVWYACIDESKDPSVLQELRSISCYNIECIAVSRSAVL